MTTEQCMWTCVVIVVLAAAWASLCELGMWIYDVVHGEDKKPRTFRGASVQLSLNGKPLKDFVGIDYGFEREPHAYELQDLLEDTTHHLICANAKRKQFQQSYKKTRQKCRQLFGELHETDKKLADVTKRYDELVASNQKLVTAILNKQPIEVTWPERIARAV